MLQALTGVNAGIYTLVLNLPFFIMAWFILKKRYVIYTIIFIVTVSGMLVVLEAVNFYQSRRNKTGAFVQSKTRCDGCGKQGYVYE